MENKSKLFMAMEIMCAHTENMGEQNLSEAKADG